MRERPILMSAPMVRALLDGRKTQTRRVMKQQPQRVVVHGIGPMLAIQKPRSKDRWLWPNAREAVLAICPYGRLGDRLWCRETHAPIIGQDGGLIAIDYRATYEHGAHLGDLVGIRKRWTSAIHMRREYSRILLEVIDVRVERLQEISDGDALEEGVYPTKTGLHVGSPRAAYRELWESIHGPGSWNANPWVWVVSFRRIEQEARAA